ncbi:hypothetical protein K461DRAFT_318130 [Myriangium duriaei CBS 260.36]|uniref:Spindle pole body-associated protein cut12 domain-containing protein n=1 Tax=Myriangium duriaei CBS 260.36 TaxID=1168546 RepID=A0A9P4MQC0_9PEZI|nr:hypothetical protein K461DRAFT_318130 [Myriangium duriaei CBS 260.36]
MLAWLSGTGPSEEHDYADASTFQDQPDTPAHIFAARAFKYRLWGTPKPGQNPPKQRARARSNEERPRIPQSRSEDMLVSPSKPNGILLTPGTTNLRRSKTVTFTKRFAEDNDSKDADLTRAKTTAVVPGKFPSPSKIDLTAIDDVPVTKPRSSFTERLQNARTTSNNDHSAAQKATQTLPSTQTKSTDKPAVALPDSTNPTDWKSRYEQYAARTEREMRKLIAKQQAAKHYAREKDARASSLAEQLRTERKRIAKLEAQVHELQTQLKAQLTTTTAVPPKPTLEQRFSAIRPPSPPKPLARPVTKRPKPAEPDLWSAAMSPSTPPRKSPSNNTLLQPRDVNVESHTPKATPPRSAAAATQRTPVRHSVASRPVQDELDASLNLPAPSPEAIPVQVKESRVIAKGVESSPFVNTPEKLGGLGRAGKISVVDKENAPPAGSNVLDSPRKALDAERRAKAAARIAARRAERERKGRGVRA